jgi:hypothetical protein
MAYLDTVRAKLLEHFDSGKSKKEVYDQVADYVVQELKKSFWNGVKFEKGKSDQ